MNKKQLEKAAIEFMEKFYSDDEYPSDIKDIRSECKDIFIAGAEWRINSVWHNVEEKPDFKMLPILLKHKSEVIHFIDETPANWGYMAKHYVHWAYIDDLLPQEKGGEREDTLIADITKTVLKR